MGEYEIKKKTFDISIKSAIFDQDMLGQKVGNIEEFFDVIKKKHGENVSKLLKTVNAICTVLAVSGATVGSLLLMRMEENEK